MESNIQLNATSILKVPFQLYEKDFTFIVNGDQYKISRIQSELLSPKVIQCRINDPTTNEFTIQTTNQGDFSYFLKLMDFTEISIPDNEIPFFIEVLDLLGNDSISITSANISSKLDEDNVIDLLKTHQAHSRYFSDQIDKEINFISMHFFKLFESKAEDLKKLDLETIERIISNPNLRLKCEDQLLSFINSLYEESNQATCLYHYVLFDNVETSSIHQFVELFDYNDLTKEAWMAVCSRLERKVEESKKYHVPRYFFCPKEERKFDGIIHYLRLQGSSNIESRVKITSSSLRQYYPPSNAIVYEDNESEFRTEDEPNSWICFEFTKNRIIPTSYEIMSNPYEKDSYQPKNWVIEGSNDNENWSVLDRQNDCPYLNGNNVCHLFEIENLNSNEFRYIRMRQTGRNWGNSDNLNFCSIEFYGNLM